MTTDLPAFFHALGFALLHFVWQAAVIGLLAAALLRLGRHWTADARYALACLGLLVMALAPIVTVTREVIASTPVEAAATEAAPLTTGTLTTAVGADTGVVGDALWLAAWRARVETSLPWLVALWVSGVAWMSFGLLRAWRGLSRMRRAARRQVPLSLVTALSRVREAMGFARRVDVAESTMVDTPTLVGWVKPVLLMPVSLTSGLSLAELESILAHELAHLRRFDHVVNGFQVAIETLLFYHPAVWWISGQVRIEREHCCDDEAMAVVGDRVVYAAALASLAEQRERAVALSLAANGGDLLSRITRILGGPMNTRHHAFSLPWAGAVLGLAAVTSIALAAAPRSAVADARTSTSVATVATPAATLPPSGQNDTGTITFLQTQLAAVDLQFRSAVQNGDRARLSTMLADTFVGTDQNGIVDTKTSFLTRTAGGSRFERLSQSVQIDGDSAIVTGIESEIRGTTRERMLFTRVWRRVAGGYQLLSSTQFRDPRPASVPGLAAAPGTVQPGRTAAPVVAGGAAAGRQAGGGSPTVVQGRQVLANGSMELRPAPSTPPMPLPENAVRVGGDIKEPTKILNVPPVYPAIAKAAGVSGVVILEAVIDETGSVAGIRVLRGIPMLDPAAVDAVSQWKYVPTMLNGAPVSLVMTVTVNFQLPKPAEQP